MNYLQHNKQNMSNVTGIVNAFGSNMVSAAGSGS